MVKLYELFTLGLIAIFIIYSNFFSNEEIIIRGCMDKKAENYNLLATEDCNGEYDGMNKDCCKYRSIDGPECYSQKEEHPCLCIFELKTKMSCDDNINVGSVYDINLLNHNRISEDIHFHELIYSGFSEYYYSKLMEISQIAYMDYYQVDGHRAIKNPQFLFFMSIEFLKRKNYKESINYLIRFLDIPNQYDKNKYIEDKAYFPYYGCCENDLDWLIDINHKSYKIARILKKILIDLENGIYDSDKILDEFKALSNLDEKDNTIDLIDNIIFSIIFSIDKPSQSLIEYRNDLFAQSKFLQLSDFNRIFKGSIPEYYLSSQIDILIFLKMQAAESKLQSLYNNNSLNSLYDIEALVRYAILQSIYTQNNDIINEISDMIDHEYDNIISRYNEIEEKKISKDSSNLYDAFEEFNNQDTDYLEKNELKKDIEKLNKYINKDRAKMIKDDWNIIINRNSGSIDLLSVDINQLNYPSFFIMMKEIVDYQYFIESIDINAEFDHYPIIQDTYKNKIQKLLDFSDIISAEKKYYEVPYLYTNPKNKKSNAIYSMYKDDLFALDLFLGLLNLSQESAAQKLKGELIKRHSKSKDDFDVGHELLQSSITLWQIVFE